MRAPLLILLEIKSECNVCATLRIFMTQQLIANTITQRRSSPTRPITKGIQYVSEVELLLESIGVGVEDVSNSVKFKNNEF